MIVLGEKLMDAVGSTGAVVRVGVSVGVSAGTVQVFVAPTQRDGHEPDAPV